MRSRAVPTFCTSQIHLMVVSDRSGLVSRALERFSCAGCPIVDSVHEMPRTNKYSDPIRFGWKQRSGVNPAVRADFP
jgi:hypothetical protein